MVKKTALMEYSRPRQGGIIGINLDEGDTLIDVALTRAGRRGRAEHAQRHGDPLRRGRRPADGPQHHAACKGINLGEDDEVVGMVVADPDGLPADRLRERLRQADAVRPEHGRRSKGMPRRTAKLAERTRRTPSRRSRPPRSRLRNDRPKARRQPSTGPRCATAGSGAAARACGTSAPASATARSSASSRSATRDDIMLITLQGMVTRTKASEIRIIGRNTQGVRVMNLNEGDKIASVAKVAREEVAESIAVEGTPPTE